jgi:hypothetical protein
MPITTHREPSRDLTVFTCEGDLSYIEIVEVIKRFYEGTIAPRTKNVLWDARTANVASLTKYQLTLLSDMAVKYSILREGGKTVLVAAIDIIFDTARTFEAETMDAKWDITVFRDIDKAMKWLEK